MRTVISNDCALSIHVDQNAGLASPDERVPLISSRRIRSIVGGISSPAVISVLGPRGTNPIEAPKIIAIEKQKQFSPGCLGASIASRAQVGKISMDTRLSRAPYPARTLKVVLLALSATTINSLSSVKPAASIERIALSSDRWRSRPSQLN